MKDLQVGDMLVSGDDKGINQEKIFLQILDTKLAVLVLRTFMLIAMTRLCACFSWVRILIF